MLDFGSTLTSLTFQIKNIGGGKLNWTITESPDESWIISISPKSGKNNNVVTLNVDRNGLTPGDYLGRIIISSNGGNQEVQIKMIVSSDGDNFLVNGDFSNGDIGCCLFVHEFASVSGTVQNGEYAVSIKNGSNVNWHIQLPQNNMLIEYGKTYSLSFEACAASPRQIGLM